MADVQLSSLLNADGSLVTNPASPSVGQSYTIKVGVLATDAQHGVRGGGTQHAAVTGVANGFMTSAQKAMLEDHETRVDDLETNQLVLGTTSGTACEGDDSRLSDDRTASGLRTATTVVVGSASAAPTSGQVPIASSPTAWAWGSPGAATLPVSYWEPRAAPASPHADDNEFDTSIADFTDWDHGAYLTNTLVTADKCLQISGTGNGTVRLGGMYKAVPSGGEFSIVAQVAHSSFTATHAATGIMVMQGTGATDDLRTMEIQNNALGADPTVVSATFAAYNGASSATATNPNTASWLRLRVNGTTVASDWSYDGITWLQLSSVTIGFTPTHMGVWTSFATANAGVAYFYCFRVKSGAGSSAFDANRPGRLVRVGN